MSSPDTSLWSTGIRPIFTLPRLFSRRTSTGTRADLLDGVRPRFRGFALAAGVFLVAIFFLFQALFNQKVLIEQQSRVNIWFLAQTEIEYLNFVSALDLYSLGDERLTKDGLIDRFEIFWSRLPVLLTGQPTKPLRQVEGLVEAANGLVKSMEALEPALHRLERKDQQELAEFRHAVETLHEPLREMVRKALLYDNTTLTAERESHEHIYYQLLALFVAILAAGIVLFFLLQRQILRTQQLVVHARGAEHSAELARSELVLAIESISEGFVIFDQENRIALFNERYREMHPAIADVIAVGARYDDLLRITASHGNSKVAPETIEAWIEARLRGHRAPGGVVENQVSGGRHLKISERKTADGRVVGVHTDVTELKEREIELTQKTALLQTTFDSIDQGIALFDADLKLQTANRLFAALDDLPAGLVTPGRPYRELIAYDAERGAYGEGEIAEQVDRQLRLLAELRAGSGGQKRIERRRPDGTAIETRYLALPDASFVKINSDITERVQAEEERGRLREQFHASQKMQAIGTLAGGIAHDFNNILASMLGNCFLLLEDLQEHEDVRERLQQIMKAGNRAKALVQQILTYSRSAEFTLNLVAVDEVISESIALIGGSLPPTVKLVSERFEKALIDADVTQLHQVMLNLCINASQAMEGKPGTITVSVTTLDASQSDRLSAGFNGQANKPAFGPAVLEGGWSRMWIGVLSPRDYCCIRIADDGCGMDRPTMTRIFEPFFTTKEVGAGTGLGLAAVHGILRNHNAVVAVSSAVGKGTVFEIYLPLSDRHSLELVPPAETDDGSDLTALTGSERILLVDDDRALLDTTRLMLTRRGYQIAAFADPEEALAAFRRAPGDWDLMLTDRSMPRLSGEALADSVLQLRPDLPIIMATGFGEAADEKRARSLGIAEFVFKPIIGKDLLIAIRRAVGAAEDTRALKRQVVR
jgi:signal transduction histidine kinase/ActR/RegA family two-component response regulator